MKRRYGGDPRWITARYTGECAGCGAEIRKGDQAFHFPRTSSLFGKACGCADQRAGKFEAEAFDEAVWNSQ